MIWNLYVTEKCSFTNRIIPVSAKKKQTLKKYKRMCLENKGEATGVHTEVRKRTFGREKPGARRQRCTGVTGSWSGRNRK